MPSIRVSDHALARYRERIARYGDADKREVSQHVRRAVEIGRNDPIPFRRLGNSRYFHCRETGAWFVGRDFGDVLLIQTVWDHETVLRLSVEMDNQTLDEQRQARERQRWNPTEPKQLAKNTKPSRQEKVPIHEKKEPSHQDSAAEKCWILAAIESVHRVRSKLRRDDLQFAALTERLVGLEKRLEAANKKLRDERSARAFATKMQKKLLGIE